MAADKSCWCLDAWIRTRSMDARDNAPERSATSPISLSLRFAKITVGKTAVGGVFVRTAAHGLRKIICFLALLWSLGVMAADYHVSGGGSDANDGASENTAWRTIGRVNDTKLKPGDRILFRCGDVFRGELRINESGTHEFPIAISAYGLGAKPVLCGSVPVSKWGQSAGGIVAVEQMDAVSAVYSDGQRQRPARYPNDGLLTTEGGDKMSLIDGKGLPAHLDLTDATVRVRACEWQYEVMKVASRAGNRLSFTQKMVYQCAPGHGYFLDDKLAFLDSPGEWFYDSTARRLYFMPAEGCLPDAVEVEATTHDSGIVVGSGVVNVAIQGLTFEKYRTAAVRGLKGSGHITIRECTIRNIATFGIVMESNCSHYEISGNAIEDIGGRGISIFEGSDNKIEGNVVRRIGLVAGYGFDGGNNNAIGICISRPEITYKISAETLAKLEGVGVPAATSAQLLALANLPYPDGKFLKDAITRQIGEAEGNRFAALIVQMVKEEIEGSDGQTSDCRNNRIAYNIVEDTGYTGIRLDGHDSIAEYNVVRNTLLRMSDGAAIYCWAQNDNFTFANIIRSNIIISALGNVEGVPAKDQSGYNVGIYLDNKTHHIIVERNLVMRCARGIVVNDESHDHQILGNTCYDNQHGLEFNEYITPGSLVRCVASNNLLYAKDKGHRALVLRSQLRNEFRPAFLDGNIYLGLGPALISQMGPQGKTRNFTLEEWRESYGQDAKSSTIIGRDALILFNEGKRPAEFTVPTGGTYWDLDGRPAGAQVLLQPFASSMLLVR